MKRVFIDKSKTPYKANLHAHSTFSDGKLSVEQIKEEYKNRGYSVVAFTDHEHLVDNSHLNDENFLAITACEMAIKEFPDQSTLKNHQMRVTHLNIYALSADNTLTPCYNSVADHFINDSVKDKIRFEGEYERIYSPEGINDMVEKIRQAGFIVCYNHPSWSLETAADYLNYDGFFAVEIFNTGCFNQFGFTDEHVLDDFHRSGKQIFCVAADDAHTYFNADGYVSDAFGGWVQIYATSLSYKDIMRALQYGDFYASTGPEIKSLVLEDGFVKAEFSSAAYANIITSGRRAQRCAAPEEKTINSACFPVTESDGYFRITVTDSYGRKAYSQIYQI